MTTDLKDCATPWAEGRITAGSPLGLVDNEFYEICTASYESVMLNMIGKVYDCMAAYL